MRSRRSVAGLMLIGVLIGSLGAAGCSAGGGSHGSSTPSPSRSVASARPSPTATFSSTGRPLQPVPAVKPHGFTDPPQGRGVSRYLQQQVVWDDCGTKDTPSRQCADVLVPLDWDKPNGRAITLAVARKPATGPRSKGVLFINPGGPGGSGVDFVDYFKAHGLDTSYDLVGWDPRGVGRSTPVRCFDDEQMEDYTAADYSPDDQQEIEQLIKLNTRFGRACLAHSGKLLQHISTEDTVRDLDLLRQLFGQKQLNYFGSSYGTSIGAMYATRYPDNVGRMVLDGPTNVGGANEVSQTQGFNRTLGNFATWCAAQHCVLGSTRQEVLGAVTGLLQRLDQHPIPGGRRDLTQALATTGLMYALYYPANTWPTLLRGLTMAVNGDGSALLQWADAYNERDSDGDFGQFNDSFPAIRCLDVTDDGVNGALQEWRTVEKQAPALGPFIGPDLGCPTWPVKSTGDTERKISYDNSPPVLIVGTTGDPATPYEYAQHMHRALRSSRLITLQGNGHLAFDQSSCVQQKVLQYLIDEQTPTADSTCKS